MQSRQRYRGLAAAARFSEERRRAMARFRLEVDRYVQDVQSRPIVPWTTVVTEISQRRPQGVWITRVSGNGPRFRAQLAAQNPALIGDYLTRLQDSPCVDFAGRPGATMATTPGSTGSTQILGRVTGE